MGLWESVFWLHAGQFERASSHIPLLSVQELAMLEYELLHFRPSQLASAATLLAQLYMNDAPRWVGSAACSVSLPLRAW